MIIYTTFLEIINKEKAISGDFTEKLEKRVKKRIREEQPSWISLDRELGEGDGNTLLDYVDESGELTQEKGDYARAGDF